MPRISEEFLDCAVFLYATADEAQKGDPDAGGGSGFLLGVPAGTSEPLVGDDLRKRLQINLCEPSPDPWAHHPHIYVVSNRHVLRENRFVRINKKAGVSAVIKVQTVCCHQASDLAVAPVHWDRRWEHAFKFRLVPYAALLSESMLRELDVGIGDDVFCVGRFRGLQGGRTNTPVARFGHIAAMTTQIEVVDEGAPEDSRSTVQNVLLVESRINQGYSGSPVFLNLPPWELREYHEQTWRQKLYERRWPTFAMPEVSAPHFTPLLGITTALIEDHIEPGLGRSGMMAVVPAWELLELLNYPDIAGLRLEEAKGWEKAGEFNLPRGTPA